MKLDTMGNNQILPCSTIGLLKQSQVVCNEQDGNKMVSKTESNNFQHPQVMQKPPDPEVSGKPIRRKFSVAYKLRILQETDNATKPSEIGSILRREGLYSSHLSKWRRQKKRGRLDNVSLQKRAAVKRANDGREKKLVDLERKNRHLKRRLAQAEQIIDIQKKISEILGIPLKS